MRNLRIIFVTLILLSLSAFSVSFASPYGIKTDFGTKWVGNGKFYDVHDGIVTANTGKITDSVSAPEGHTATCITPNTKYTDTAPLGIKHTSLSGVGIDLSNIKYVRYLYYYEGDYNGRAMLTFPKIDFSTTKDRTVYSLETVVSGKWAYLTFDIEQELFGYIFTGGTLCHMEFYPFGNTKVSELSSGNIYLREVGIFGNENANVLAAISNGTLVQKYPVAFVPGRPDVSGTAPETIYAEVGQTITLPENTFVREGYTFKGWICSFGSAVMQPGDSYTVTERLRIGGQTTAAVDFIANWVLTADLPENTLLSNVKRVKVADAFNGIVDSHKYKYGKYAENVEFDGLVTAKFVPDPDGTHATTSNIVLDGYNWTNMPLDLAYYKYLIIPYYYKTTREKVSHSPRLTMLGGADRAITKTMSFTDVSIKANQWALMVFSFDFVNNSTLSPYLDPEHTILNQMHFYPFGYTKASTLPETDELYIADFIFLSEIPSSRPIFSAGILSGNGDGTFRPNEFLTRAEAASMLAKFLGFTDYSGTDTGYTDISSHWCLPYVSFLEKKGVLIPSAKEKFCPEDLCTATELLEFIANSQVGKKVNTTPFGSIPSQLSDEKYISRGEAVNLITSIKYGTYFSQSDAQKYLKGQTLYSDTNENQWYYPSVAFYSVPTVSYKKDGMSKVIDTFIDAPSTEDAAFPEEKYTEAAKYLAELDKVTSKRITEIRNTDSVYKQKDGGKTVYLSNTFGSGTLTNSSEANPYYISSVSEVSNLKLDPGDVVLFRRGEVYRGNFITVSGVTYSAYGEGDKPVIMPSPENGSGSSKWILDYEDKATGKKIWKYYREDISDIGGINLISADGTHLVAYKEIPNYSEGVFFKRSNPAEEFIYTDELDHNYEYVHLANKSSAGVIFTANPGENASGPVYLRCDEGNPGRLYPSIEFNANYHAIKAKSNVTIDNLCIKYFGRHGISAGTVHNLIVTNCEIGWGGGSIQSYKNGKVTRFGNGVEIYGALVNYIIDNCYVYEIYDAGITHQISSTSGGNYYMEGVYYTNNVLINSTYNIEYFMSKNNAEFGVQERYMKNVYFTDNITRGAGYGWGMQRPDSAPSNVKGWTHHNLCDNQVYENNIFDRCADLPNRSVDYTIMTGTTYESSTPYLVNNIFVQVPGRLIMMYGKSTYRCDLGSEELIDTLCGDGNKVYFARDDIEDHAYKVFWK